VLYNEKTT